MSRVVYSARDYKLVSSFETVRETLLQDRYSDRLSKPLAYWALPNDRRLPLAFLNRSIGDLVNTPFDELSATPGIGQKKISSLVKLLMRATKDQPPAVPFGLSELAEERNLDLRIDPGARFDAFLVSEALWSEWTETVRSQELGDECLGRIADSLNSMPTVIWEKRLADYQNLTLMEIRQLRTHGEKRVRCVLQVFHKVQEAIRRIGDDMEELRRQLGSPRIRAVTEWCRGRIAAPTGPTSNEVRTYLAEPLLKQIEIDCGGQVHQIACQRLGIDCEPMSVRTQAQALGVTRARVYQLLDDCHKVVSVRWPEGKSLLDQLTARLGMQPLNSQHDDSLFVATRQLCFPDRAQAIYPNSAAIPHQQPSVHHGHPERH